MDKKTWQYLDLYLFHTPNICVWPTFQFLYCIIYGTVMAWKHWKEKWMLLFCTFVPGVPKMHTNLNCHDPDQAVTKDEWIAKVDALSILGCSC